jgi:hypothetical protein
MTITTSVMLWTAFVVLCLCSGGFVRLLLAEDEPPSHRVVDVILIAAAACGAYGVWQVLP